MNTELTTAVTDLLLSLFCFAAAWAVGRQSPERSYHTGLWQKLFLTYGAAALFGYLYHRVETKPAAQELWWLLLYPAIFEATRHTLLAALYARFGSARPGPTERRWIFGIEVALCGIAMVLRFFFRGVSLGMYLVFATVSAVLCLYHYGVLLREKRAEARCFFGGMFLVILSIAAQRWQKGVIRLLWEFDNNGVCHLLLIAALGLFFGGAVLSLRRESKNR